MCEFPAENGDRRTLEMATLKIMLAIHICDTFLLLLSAFLSCGACGQVPRGLDRYRKI
jgi:hypothetical protein